MNTLTTLRMLIWKFIISTRIEMTKLKMQGLMQLMVDKLQFVWLISKMYFAEEFGHWVKMKGRQF